MKQVILASGSPRRREILTQIGVPFTVCTADVDENISTGSPETWPMILAERKALAVSVLHPSELVLGFDTLVICDGKALGKPKDEACAVQMLKNLNGRSHFVVSGVAIALNGNVLHSNFERTEVIFRNVSEQTIKEYVNSKEPMDKAGAYGIQGLGARLVKSINGCYYNVVGLPVAKTLEILESLEA